jgi:AcrR family transcriptional regulator
VAGSRSSADTSAVPRMRADARRNRGRILAAARDLFIERGPDAPLEEIAARARVGIATLYRRFPDRASLSSAVVLETLVQAAEEARHAMTEEPDAFTALARYLHRALDLRIAAVIPALLGEVPLDEDDEIVAARDEASRPVEEMIRRAHEEGTLRPDVVFGDVGLLVIRLSRPLPGSFEPSVERGLAHRHMDLVIDGLHSVRASDQVLPEPALSLEDLRALGREARSPADVRSSRHQN